LRDLAEGVRRGDLVSPGDWAFAYAEAQDVDGTLRWIDSMRVSRDPQIFQVPISPTFDFIRRESRYQAWEANLPWRHPSQ
jgi:hypothetical protein